MQLAPPRRSQALPREPSGRQFEIFSLSKRKQQHRSVLLFLLATVYKNDTVSNGFIWFHTKMKPWRMEVKPYLSVRKTGC